MIPKRPLGLSIIGILMAVFGVAEMATGLTHNFLGEIAVARTSVATYLGVAIGALYALAGLLVLSQRKWAATLALVCLGPVIVGRIAFVATGLFPVDSPKQVAAIIIGTSLAVAFAIYVGLRWKSFRSYAES